MANLFIIKRPHITEKSTVLSSKGRYVFVVALEATKIEVKKAIKALYKVDPVSVQMTTLPGKKKRFRNSFRITPSRKKAIVTLKEGQKIDFGV